LKNKTILITGGTGSFGKHFAKYLIEKTNYKKIIIFSRDELKQYEMKNIPIFKRNEKKMRYFIGDIRDKSRLIHALHNVNYVIHAAALKQVDTSEYNPTEFIETNIVGTQNLIDACGQQGVEKFLGLSTDKAVSPMNLYGATKLCSEKIIISSNNYFGGKNIKLSVARYGNVFGSRGSVVEKFSSIERKTPLPITDKKMTRFNILLDHAANFVFKRLKEMNGREIFIPKCPSYNIVNLAKAFGKDRKIKITGIRNGEKLHEELFSIAESYNVIDFKDYYILFDKKYEKLSQQQKKNIFLRKGKRLSKNFSYNSKDNAYIKQSDLEKLINSYQK
jgi:UDP-N-acetylglucosamine 4,6-dehydratase